MKKAIGQFLAFYNSSIASLEGENSIVDWEKSQVILDERISRKKNSGHFPLSSVKHLLAQNPKSFAGTNKFSGNCYFRSLAGAQEVFVKPELKNILKSFKADNLLIESNDKIQDLSHHLCHAYSCLVQYPFEESIIIVADGVGSKLSEHPAMYSLEDNRNQKFEKEPREAFSVFHQKGKKLECIYKEWEVTYHTEVLGKELTTGTSLGNVYAAGAHVVFGNWLHSGKLMGLSIYGEADEEKLKLSSKSFLEDYILIQNFKWLPKSEFDSLSEKAFKARADFAATVQAFHNKRLLEKVELVKKKRPQIKNLAFAGGCALNCLSNDALWQQNHFERVFIPSAPDDTGISLGAAFVTFMDESSNFQTTPIERIRADLGSVSNDIDSEVDPVQWAKVAIELLTETKILPVAIGRGELGPRALGFRSILADPLEPGIVKTLNDTVKFRESFRPYGIMILQEEVSKYFKVASSYHSPFMSFAPEVSSFGREVLKEVLPPNSRIRIQTVTYSVPHIYELLKLFQEKTAHPILINTSLNIMGEPICDSKQDVMRFLAQSDLPVGLLGLDVVRRKNL